MKFQVLFSLKNNEKYSRLLSAAVVFGTLRNKLYLIWSFFFFSVAPVTCPAGKYTIVPSTSCITCPAGSYCAVTYAAPVACSTGEYSIAGETSCSTCGAGMRAQQLGLPLHVQMV